MKRNKEDIIAAFSVVSRLVRNGEPVILTKVDGLNSTSCGFFKEAVTHSFTEEKHGFNLQKIFIIDSNDEHKWKRASTPNNPDDVSVIDLIMKAMTYVGKEKAAARKTKKELSVVDSSNSDYSTLSIEELNHILYTVQEELEHRKKEEEQKALLADFLSKTNMTTSDLCRLLKIV